MENRNEDFISLIRAVNGYTRPALQTPYGSAYTIWSAPQLTSSSSFGAPANAFNAGCGSILRAMTVRVYFTTLQSWRA